MFRRRLSVMKQKLNRRWRVTLWLLGVALVAICWLTTASLRGRLVARHDVAAGRYEVQVFGVPTPWEPTYASLLKEKYGVEKRVVADHTISPWLAAYVEAYDEIVKAGAKEKYGRDIFSECQKEAIAQYLVEHSRKI